MKKRYSALTTRRFFIGGLASAFACGCGSRRIFSAAPGEFSEGRPELSFGLLSDVHLCLAPGGERLIEPYGAETFLKALEWFRDNGADAVVIAGDIAHSGLGGELMAASDAWFKVFPDDKAPDSRHVERVFVFGNHEWSSPVRAKTVCPDEAVRKENLLVANPAKWWDAAFHEEWKPFFSKKVKGYDFFCAHWCNGGCNGTKEKFTKGLCGYYESLKGSIDPSLPFFHVQHPHPRGTVHGDKVWGQDDGQSVKALSQYHNAVAFSGHSHISLTDERSVWQGSFTSVGCASLRNVSLGVPGIVSATEGFENGNTPHAMMDAVDPLKAMVKPDRMDCRQGQFVRVYSDRIVFSRREFITGTPLVDDLVMPLPAAESRPFEFASRQAKAHAPEFPAKAALKVSRTKCALRGKGKGKKPKEDAWEVVIPAALADGAARPGVYEVTVECVGGETRTFAVHDVGARFPRSDPRAQKPQLFRVACRRLPSEARGFSVCAVSCWGCRSRPLAQAVPVAG